MSETIRLVRPWDKRINDEYTSIQERRLPMTTQTTDYSSSNTVKSKATPAVWTGRVLSGLASAFLFMDATMKLLDLPIVTETGLQLGWPAGTAIPLGITLFAIAVLYTIPRTAILGAILLTGYLGGAVATHARIGNPIFTHTLFGVYVGLMAWSGLWLRDERLRKLLP
jgi:hypothetical protein